jgi:hypothetical protein
MSRIVDFARQQVGLPYAFGAAGRLNDVEYTELMGMLNAK